MSVPDLVAEGSGYYRVYVDGVEVSQHTTERKAVQRAMAERAANPSSVVTYDHDYLVRVGAQVKETTEEPVEDDTSDDTTGADPAWTDDFESGEFVWADGDGPGWDSSPWAGPEDIEINEENPRTGSRSMMIRFPDDGDLDANGEWPDGSGGRNRKPHFQVGKVKEFWMEYWLYVPDNYRHADQATRSHNRKFWVVWDEDRRDEHVALYLETHTGDEDTQSPPRCSELRVYQNMRYRSDEMKGWFSDGGGLGCGLAECPGDFLRVEDRGTWVRLRFHYRLSSANGVNDGAFHIWKDDEIVVQAEGIDAYPGSDDLNFYLHKGQIFGAQNSPFDEVTKFYLDDIAIWHEDPGWL